MNKVMVNTLLAVILAVTTVSCSTVNKLMPEDNTGTLTNELLYLSTSYVDFKKRIEDGSVSFSTKSKDTMNVAVKAIDAFFMKVKVLDLNKTSIDESFTLFRVAARAIHEMNNALAEEDGMPDNLMKQLLATEVKLQKISGKFNKILSYATLGFQIHDEVKDVISLVNNYLKKL